MPAAQWVSTRRPATSGTAKRASRPGLGPEAVRDVLGREPRLDRVAVDRDVVLGEAQRLARGDPQLLGDEVAAR